MTNLLFKSRANGIRSKICFLEKSEQCKQEFFAFEQDLNGISSKILLTENKRMSGDFEVTLLKSNLTVELLIFRSVNWNSL